jgi:uncharacterized protein (DUF983 family)
VTGELRTDGLCGPCGYADFVKTVSTGFRFKCPECHARGMVSAASRKLGTCPACGEWTLLKWTEVKV